MKIPVINGEFDVWMPLAAMIPSSSNTINLLIW